MAQDPLNLVCIEPRFPGRLGAVAVWLVRKRGYRCWFFCNQVDARNSLTQLAGSSLEIVPFPVGGIAREPSVHWTRQLERGLCYAYAAWEALESRRPYPVDIVLGRTAGLGSTLFAPVFAPRTPIVNLFDYYLHPRCNDLAEELGPSMPDDYFHWRRAANAMDLLDLENGIHPWSPTVWQRDLYPLEYRQDFTILFDGIDAKAQKRPSRKGRRIGGKMLDDSTFVMSFVSSDLDRLRGFDRFIDLTNRLVREGVDVLAIAAGSPVVRRPFDIPNYGRNYSSELLAQVDSLDPSRVWLLGEVSETVLRELLAASDLHCYPSRPFPISRSLVEAMSMGATTLAWDSPPVREFVTAGKTGWICRTDDPQDAVDQALAVAKDPGAHAAMGEAAADQALRLWERDQTLPRLAAWFDRLAKG